MSDHSESVIQELQNSIGALYTQLATLKAQAVDELNKKDQIIESLQAELNNKKEK